MNMEGQTPTARKSAQRAGFTFMELLIAATMMSILFVGLGSHLRGGIIVWRQTTRTVETLQRVRVALDWLARDLANAFLFGDGQQEAPLPEPAFGSSTLEWMAVEPSFQGQPTARHIGYRCASDVEGTQGLWRTSQSIGVARTGHEPTPELLLPGCETLEIRYAYQPEEEGGALIWQPDWRYPEELPRLLEVTVRISAGQAWQRTMVIPHGSLKPLEEEAGG
jgi:type II secretory pathway pseudopilin PulG